MRGAMTGSGNILVGRVLDGRYRLDERIGKGGMGEVYRGLHLMMDRPVAIKLLRADRANDTEAVRRFTREAKSTSRVDHPNCVRVTDFGVDGGELMYLVMEYLDGRTVYDDVRCDGPMTAKRAAHIGRQVANALDSAHQMGFIHRDLKPENIMLINRDHDPDFAKVLDFGLAKLLTGPNGIRTHAISVSPLTKKGMVFGTPEYMSPEQATDSELTPATDLYSLGVVMYEMLTAALPFSDKNIMAVLTMHIQRVPVPPAEVRPDLAIPPALDALVMECLAKQASQRPADARALADRLTSIEASLLDDASRLPRQVASSSTIDLSAASVRTAAAPESHGPGQNEVVVAVERREFGNAATVGLEWSEARASAETIGLDSATPSAPPHGGVRWSSQPSGHDNEVIVTHQVRRPRRGLWIATALGVTAAAVAGMIAALANQSSVSDPGDRPVPTLDRPADRATDPATSPSPTEVVLPPQPTRTAATAADPAAPSATQSSPPARRSSLLRAGQRRSRPRQKKLETLLAKAQVAQKKGNILGQMANAQAAFKLAPSDLMARYLFGDALVRSSDAANVARGCKLLRKAFRVPAARSAFRRALCARLD